MSDDIEMPDLTPVLTEYRRWCLRNTPEEKKADRFSMLVAVIRPDGRIVTAMPGWQGSEEGDEDAFRAEIHGWVDSALAMRHQDLDEGES